MSVELRNEAVVPARVSTSHGNPWLVRQAGVYVEDAWFALSGRDSQAGSQGDKAGKGADGRIQAVAADPTSPLPVSVCLRAKGAKETINTWGLYR